MRRRDALRILYLAIVVMTLAVGAIGIYGLHAHLQSMKEFDSRMLIDTEGVR